MAGRGPSMPVRGEHTCMKSLINTPLDQIAAEWWGGIDDACKKAFFVAVVVNVLAFGFEMTNLSLHHDDVASAIGVAAHRGEREQRQRVEPRDS